MNDTPDTRTENFRSVAEKKADEFATNCKSYTKFPTAQAFVGHGFTEGFMAGLSHAIEVLDCSDGINHIDSE